MSDKMTSHAEEHSEAESRFKEPVEVKSFEVEKIFGRENSECWTGVQGSVRHRKRRITRPDENTKRSLNTQTSFNFETLLNVEKSLNFEKSFNFENSLNFEPSLNFGTLSDYKASLDSIEKENAISGSESRRLRVSEFLHLHELESQRQLFKQEVFELRSKNELLEAELSNFQTVAKKWEILAGLVKQKNLDLSDVLVTAKNLKKHQEAAKKIKYLTEENRRLKRHFYLLKKKSEKKFKDLTKKLEDSKAKIESTTADYRQMETGHFDFVAFVKSLLVCDVSIGSNQDPTKRLESLTKSLNDAILIDFGVKDEPSEVKSESLETFT